MRIALLLAGALATLLVLGCSTRAQAVAEADDPCFVVSAPLERMVISCHPTPGPGECSFRVDRANEASGAHVAQLAHSSSASCQDSVQAYERRQLERKTCPIGTRLQGEDCVPG